MAIDFEIRFDGLDADHHELDMRLLGRALIGTEKVVTDVVVLATEHRLPVRADSRFLTVRVSPPHAACFEIKGSVEAAAGVLPIVLDTLKHPGTKLLFQFMSYMLNLKGGKPKEAERNLMEALRLMQEDAKDSRREIFANEEKWRQHTLALAQLLQRPLRDMVAPIGSSAETLALTPPTGERATVVDVAMAQVIRSGEALEVGEMVRLKIRVDGVIKHSRHLKVEIEGTPGAYVTAEVRDPAFDIRPNAYTRALDSDGFIAVDAKPTYKDGVLHRLHIMNAA